MSHKAYNSAKQRIPAVKYYGADSAGVRRYSDNQVTPTASLVHVFHKVLQLRKTVS